MARQIDMMRRREIEIAEIMESVSDMSSGFTDPSLVTVGGYALRAFVPFSRYTRDCDFVVSKGEDWAIDRIRSWSRGRMEVEAFEKRKTYGFLRLVRPFRLGRRTVRASLDFMEGEVRGRTDEQVVLIDQAFIERRQDAVLRIGGNEIGLFVPHYTDYLIMKLVSGRPSDVRDVAALVWKKGLSSDFGERVGELVPDPDVVKRTASEIIIPEISDRRFVDSWRGTFVTTDFGEKEKSEVLEKLEEMTGIL